MAGQMLHIEIPAEDTDRAQAFWGGLFGWQFQPFEGSPTPYLMFRNGETSGGAIMGTDGATRGARTYFDVDDIRASTEQVKELGGEADGPMPVPTMGWFSTCRDPHGNEFGLWQTDPSAG